MGANTIKPLVTISGTAVGGRNGRTESSDGIIQADLSFPHLNEEFFHDKEYLKRLEQRQRK